MKTNDTILKTLRNNALLLIDSILDNTASFNIKEAHDILVISSSLYNNGDENFIDDAEYDIIENHLRKIDPTNKFFIGVGAEVRGTKVTLPHKMGSLNQVYENDTVKWINLYNLREDSFILSDKLDGMSVLILYDHEGKLQIAYSRGNGEQGADITRHVSKITNLPKKTLPNLTIRGEIIIRKTDFLLDEVQEIKNSSGNSYKNPQAMVSGLMNSSSNVEFIYEHIKVVAYEIITSSYNKNEQLIFLNENSFETVRYSTCIGKILNDPFLIKYLSNTQVSSPYELDGIVIDINSNSTRNLLKWKAGSLNPPYTKKFKSLSDDNIKETKVIEVLWEESKHRTLKPRLHIEPVELFGTTVEYVTAHNAKYIKEMGLGTDAIIKITKSGTVIPYILDVIKHVEPNLPSCDFEWNENHVEIIATDIKENTLSKLKLIEDFFTSLNIAYLKMGNIKKLYESGYNNVVKIIQMSQEEMVEVMGANGFKSYKSLLNKLHQPIPEYELAGATSYFGKGIGVRKLKLLYNKFGNLTKLSYDDILNTDGFDVKTTELIVNGLPQYQDFLKILDGYYTFEAFKQTEGGIYSEHNVVFTGFRDDKLKKYIERHGGDIKTTVNKKTTLVVVSDITNASSKLTKAKDLGIKIISKDELIKQIKLGN